MNKVEAEIPIKVPFHDVDSMRVVWHGNYAKYFAAARCALLDQINYNYNQMAESGYAWPVIDLRIRYVKPAVFNQEILVKAELLEYENRLKIGYLIRDAESDTRLTKGHTVQVAVDMHSQEMCLYSPQILWDKLGMQR